MRDVNFYFRRWVLFCIRCNAKISVIFFKKNKQQIAQNPKKIKGENKRKVKRTLKKSKEKIKEK